MALDLGSVSMKFKVDSAAAHTGLGKMKSQMGNVNSSAHALRGTILRLGAALGGLYALKQIGTFLISSAKAGMEDARAKAVLHKAIRNVTAATDKELNSLDAWIEKMQLATGYTEESMRPSLIKLAGASLETVVSALEKAQRGNMVGLMRLGVQTKKADGTTLTYTETLAKLSQMYGGTLAEAADSTEGKFARMQLMWGEFRETIGAALLPILDKLAGWFLAHASQIEAFGAMIGDVLGGNFAGLGATIEKLLPALGRFGQKLFEAILPKTPAIAIGLAKLVYAIGKWLITEGIPLLWGYLVQWSRDAWEWFVPRAPAIFAKMIELLKGLGSWITGTAIPWLAKKLPEWASAFVKWLVPKLPDIIKALGLLQVGITKWIFLDLIPALVKGLWTAAVSMGESLGAGLRAKWPDIKAWFVSLPGKIRALFAGAASWLWNKGVDLIQGIWEGAKSKAKSFLVWLASLIPGVKISGSTDTTGGSKGGTGPPKAGASIGKGKMAWGTIATSPQVSLIGEGGPEAVIPLNSPVRANQLMQQAGLGGGDMSLVVAAVEKLTAEVRAQNKRFVRLANSGALVAAGAL
jgi:hypothetical protein